MAIEVKIPTILRTYTDGEKVVQGEGGRLSALIDDLESQPRRSSRTAWSRTRTAPTSCGASSTSTSTTRTSASSAASTPSWATATRS